MLVSFTINIKYCKYNSTYKEEGGRESVRYFIRVGFVFSRNVLENCKSGIQCLVFRFLLVGRFE